MLLELIASPGGKRASETIDRKLLTDFQERDLAPMTELPTEARDSGDTDRIQEARRWRDNGWTAQVIKNEDDDGWAVAMTPDGQAEPALVGPWTMGRDKKNPKPLDSAAFTTLVKTASEFVRRHEQQLHATLHQGIAIAHGGRRVTVTLDIEPDEDNPSALLRAVDGAGEVLAQVRVAPSFKLTRASASAWAQADFSAEAARKGR
jgi:hypothetical protein